MPRYVELQIRVGDDPLWYCLNRRERRSPDAVLSLRNLLDSWRYSSYFGSDASYRIV